MSLKTATRRAVLREALIDLAEAQIAVAGPQALRARALAEEAGCSVGMMYTAFGDMSGLMLAVNARSLRRFCEAAAAAMAEVAGAPPRHQLVTLSLAYLDFAADHTALWRALLATELAADTPVPLAYTQVQEQVFAWITEPLTALNPELDSEATERLTRAIVASVHGMVLTGLDPRFAPLPREEIAAMIAQTLKRLT